MANDSGNPEILRSAQNPRATAVVTPEEKLSGDMLMLTTGFMMCAAALWLAIYWRMGHQYSTAISLMIYMLLWYFASEKQKLRAMVDAQHEMIREEKERSERLLLNILPPAIADRLKRNEMNIAQGHADVTVMFADIVGFTRMTEELSPVETVKILNDVFSIFDDIADKHRV